MPDVLDVLTIIFLFALYAFVHSFLASSKVKESIAQNFGNLIAFYRFAYNVFAILSLYVVYEISPKPHLIIYDLQTPFDIIVLIPQFIAIIGIFWSFKYICAKEFLGLNQIKRYLRKNYSAKWDEELTLTIGGPYKYSRHPVYFFSIIFLMFRPTMDLFYLTFFLIAVVYFYIGSYFEEKKLVNHFGDIYVKYQNTIPRIFPAFPLQVYREEITRDESN